MGKGKVWRKDRKGGWERGRCGEKKERVDGKREGVEKRKKGLTGKGKVWRKERKG